MITESRSLLPTLLVRNDHSTTLRHNFAHSYPFFSSITKMFMTHTQQNIWHVMNSKHELCHPRAVCSSPPPGSRPQLHPTREIPKVQSSPLSRSFCPSYSSCLRAPLVTDPQSYSGLSLDICLPGLLHALHPLFPSPFLPLSPTTPT